MTAGVSTAALDDEDLVRAYDAIIMIRHYLRPDVTAEERGIIASDIVACVAGPLRRALRAEHIKYVLADVGFAEMNRQNEALRAALSLPEEK